METIDLFLHYTERNGGLFPSHTGKSGQCSPAPMAVLLDVLHELLVFFRGPGALLETILITARRPSH